MTDLHAAEVEENQEYTSASPEHLLEALEQAGHTPDCALLEACLDRREDLIPGLLEMLEAGIEQGDDEEWDKDEPRWYRDIHAGLFLCAFREEKALPLFADIFRDEECKNLLEWFDRAFVHYGPLAVDMLIDVVKDRKAHTWGRIYAAGRLMDIARLHPEVRDRAVEVLRARLPRIDEEGNFVIPPFADDDQVEFWTFVALDLAELKDKTSQPQVEALYKADLIDEMLMGDVDNYLKILEEDRSHRGPRPFDLIAFYHPPRVSRPASAAREREQESDEPGFGRLLEDGGEATYVRTERKVGRNDPCPCGSGKKYKKCCGKK